MNLKSFGDNCKCGHFESDHEGVKKKSTIESATRNYSFIIPPGDFPTESGRGKCNICNCTGFAAKKSWWRKWRMQLQSRVRLRYDWWNNQFLQSVGLASCSGTIRDRIRVRFDADRICIDCICSYEDQEKGKQTNKMILASLINEYLDTQNFKIVHLSGVD